MIHAIRKVVGEFLSQFVQPKYGTVTSYDPTSYQVKVMIEPEQVETDWIQIASPFVGSSFGAVFGPTIGDQVMLIFIEGTVQAAIVGGRFFSQANPAPGVASGAAYIADNAGTSVLWDAAGKLIVTAPTEVTVNSPLVQCSGDVTANGISLIHHVHSGVTPGGGNTGAALG